MVGKKVRVSTVLVLEGGYNIKGSKTTFGVNGQVNFTSHGKLRM